MHLFYAPEKQGEYCVFSPEESLHCAKVLRLKEGDEVWLADGMGNMYRGLLEVVHPKNCLAKITEVLQTPFQQNYHIHIAVAPTKNIERIEWFLEKATEVGIHEISLVFCEHSERTQVKYERLQKVLIAAMKQSLQSRLPRLNPAVSFVEFIKQNHNAETKYIAYCADEYPKIKLTSQNLKSKSILVLIGPEGDFSPREAELAVNNEFLAVSLGQTRLRTETAALYAAWSVQIANSN